LPPLEPDFSYIDLLNTAWPNNDPDQLAEADDHLRGIKVSLKGSFPSLGQTAVTKTAAEINSLVTDTSADILTNKTIDNAAYTGTQTGFAGDILGQASTISGQGALATLNSVTSAEIDANAVGSSELAANSVGSSEIIANAVKNSELANASGTGSQLVTNGTTYTLPQGWYMVGAVASGNIQVNTSGGWKNISIDNGGMCFSDGTNTRLQYNGASSDTFYWRKLS